MPGSMDVGTGMSLVLYNGMPIASGFEGTIDINEISLEAVAKIKASRPFANRWEAYLSILNLFDKNYKHRLGNPREARAVVTGLNLEY